MKRAALTYLLLLPLLSMAQQQAATFVAPLDIPLVLSANFGELRSNHFHSGLDFKTQGRTGLPVYAADEGYISRVAVSPWGYGNALYIDHPSGYTTVYAHLDSFAPFIGKHIETLQYECESFAIDTTFAAGAFPVTRGMRIGTSGNSGSSGGPHLHFEIRHTTSESPIDPLPWYAHKIKDQVAPEPRLVALYPHHGVVDGKQRKAIRTLQNQGGNRYITQGEFTAWGEISVGIKAYDRMSGTSNIYGVRKVRCMIDNKVIFSTEVDSITFAETRYVNALIDYNELRSNKGSTIMRSYIQPGNRLSTIYQKESMGNGTIIIDEARSYQGQYELTDLAGNTSTVRFTIRGVESPLPSATDTTGVTFYHNHDNQYATEDIQIEVPAGALYDDITFRHSSKPDDTYCSARHEIDRSTTPLHKHINVAIKLTCDTLPDSCYYMTYIRNGKKSPVIGCYEAGWYTARVRDLGTYAVSSDTTPPKVTPVNADNWGKKGVITFTISDNGSGIATYHGEIDGKFCLFKYDGKKDKLTCTLRNTPLQKGGKHHLTLLVTDACGNDTVVKRTFTW